MEKTVKVRLTFQDDVLGTLSPDQDVFKDYIATKNPNNTAEQAAEEASSLSEEAKEMSEEERKPITTFARMDVNGEKVPAIYGYVLKGMFKNAASALSKCDGTISCNLTAFKKNIDQLIFVNRISPLVLPDPSVYKDGLLPILTRPLRAETAQGPRVALASSEYCPAGTSIEFEITALNDTMFAAAFEWLNYGKYNGIGCWHNSGKGTFTYEVIEGKDLVPDIVGFAAKMPKKRKKPTTAE